jgi:hypothetical protein
MCTFLKTYKLYHNIKESKMRKRILSLMLLVLLLSLTISQAFGIIIHSLWLEGLRIEVYAPDEAKAGEKYNVTLNIYPDEPIYINRLIVRFDFSYSPFYVPTILYQQDIGRNTFSKTYSLEATSNYERVQCEIEISYVVNKGTNLERSYEKRFWLDLTYENGKTREELESENAELKLNYLLLSENFQKLIVIAIILVLTTIIFSASTVYLILKVRRK